MRDIKPVSKMRHNAKRWKRYESYAFAANEVMAPLVGAEFAKACMAFPIALTKNDAGFTPVALLGFITGQNLFVAKTGRWIGGYIPAAFRSYPFQLGLTSNGERILCIDEASGLVIPNDSADPKNAEEFFDEQGKPSIAVGKVLDFLKQVDESRKSTEIICDLLEEHNLIEPWPLTIDRDHGNQPIDGLFRVNEKALAQLKSRALNALHKENALMIAYCQILSTQTLPLLLQLKEAHAKAGVATDNLPKPAASGEIDFSFLGN